MSIQQAYYTRALKQMYTGEAGYGVSAASEGITKDVSVAYVKSIGDTIVFAQQTDWLYMVLAAFDGRISVTKAVPSNDGHRPCHFAHVYLMDADTSKHMLTERMEDAVVARFTGFNEDYVGEPVDLDVLYGLPSLDDNRDPRKLTIEDAGFNDEYMGKLINSIAMLHDSRAKRAAGLQYIFVQYNCPPDEFEKKAFALINLLYANLPYIVSSKLGVAIKTDNAWRTEYPTGFTSAYFNAPQKRYIPGVDLYIINQPVVPIPDNGHLLTVSEGGVTSNINVNINPPYADVINEIITRMNNKGGPDRKLARFYQFLYDSGAPCATFVELGFLLQLTNEMLEPEKVCEYNWKQLRTTLRALTACLNENFKKTEEIWHTQTKELFLDIILRSQDLIIKKEPSPPPEGYFIELFELGKFLYKDEAAFREFLDNFYMIISSAGMLDPANVKLIAAITENAETYRKLVMLDQGNLEQENHLLAFVCAGALKTCTLEELPGILELYNSYTMSLVTDALYDALYRLTEEGLKATEVVKIIQEGNADTNNLTMIASMLLYLQSCNFIAPEKCNKIYKTFEEFTKKYITDHEINDTWAARYYIRMITRTENEIDGKTMLDKYGTIINTMQANEETEKLNQIAVYRDYMFKKSNEFGLVISNNGYILKYLSLEQPYCTISFESMIKGELEGKFLKQGIKDFFGLLFKLWKRINISFEDFKYIYGDLKERVITESGALNNELDKTFQELVNEYYTKNKSLLLILTGLYAVYKLNSRLSSITSFSPLYSVHCDKCNSLMPYTTDVSKSKCRNCGKKLDDKGKKLGVQLYYVSAEDYNSMLSVDKAAKKAAYKNADSKEAEVTIKREGLVLVQSSHMESANAKNEQILNKDKHFFTSVIIHSSSALDLQLAKSSDVMPSTLVAYDDNMVLPESATLNCISCSKKRIPYEIINDIAINKAL